MVCCEQEKPIAVLEIPIGSIANTEQHMAIVKQDDLSTLIECWVKDEMEGVQFPVPFDLVWQMAGYHDKATAYPGFRLR